MLTDKEVKAQFRKTASADPDRFYATGVLKENGFSRKSCQKCGTMFWSSVSSDVCGKGECSGGFRFIGVPRKKLSYIGVWKEFSRLFTKLGYTPIKRYPVVARWREDTDFVQASIYDFQPYVVSGEVEPPANPLVVPQFCLRFNDIDNVGITGSHYTGFVMIGQHAFLPPEQWNQNKIFSDIYTWLVTGLGLKKEEITFHEDVWAGGGNFGPSMEYFSGGLELGNQVYMLYEKTSTGYKELKLRVCDMGMGQERNAWFSSGANTSYDVTFPTVMERLKSMTGIRVDGGIIKKFLPYSSNLNIDEIENIDAAWRSIAGCIKIDVKELKKNVLDMAALYSVAEHSRTLLVALSDGALPSNVGGGYNLRTLYRRACNFIDKYGWKVDVPSVCSWHAAYLKPLFPELSKSLAEIDEILKTEEEKFRSTKEKSRQIVSGIIKTDISENKLIELYDSHGIAPELIKEEAEKQGKTVKVPQNFYALVSGLHEKTGPEEKKTLPLDGLPDTRLDYYEDQGKKEFAAKVLKIIGNHVILDATYFYPKGGGQESDHGMMNGCRVYNVEKFGSIVVHYLEKTNFAEGDAVECVIDWERREQLTKHHTAVHIVNAAASKILGKHVFQAGTGKGVDKAHLDITHYKALADEELEKIEKEANDTVKKSLKVRKTFRPREEAERDYGFSIYQGGVVPGKKLRIVEINGIDVEACGGTHLDNTAEAGRIIITKSERIQDGVVRIELVAGKAAEELAEKDRKILHECLRILGATEKTALEKTEELFNEWKSTRKKSYGGIAEDLKKEFKSDVLIKKLEGVDAHGLQEISKAVSTESTVIVFFSVSDKVYVFCSAGTKTETNAGELAKRLCAELGGKGGGTKTIGQGFGAEKDKVDGIIKKLKEEFS